MKIYSAIPSDLPKTGLTIGTFDGVHLGHRALLKALKEKAPFVTVVTFTNHPQEAFGSPPVIQICSLEKRLSLLEALGVDAAIAIPFTLEFASTPFDRFLQKFSLSCLVLGEGSAFGKGREGTRENVTTFAEKEGFIVEYLPKVLLDGEPVSSRRIRAALANRDFELSSRLLGRNG